MQLSSQKKYQIFTPKALAKNFFDHFLGTWTPFRFEQSGIF